MHFIKIQTIEFLNRFGEQDNGSTSILKMIAIEDLKYKTIYSTIWL